MQKASHLQSFAEHFDEHLPAKVYYLNVNETTHAAATQSHIHIE